MELNLKTNVETYQMSFVSVQVHMDQGASIYIVRIKVIAEELN